MERTQISWRLPTDLVDDIDVLHDKLTSKGEGLTKTDVYTVLLRRGLGTIKSEPIQGPR